MRKSFAFFILLAVSVLFAYCSHSKKATATVTEVPKLTYQANIQPIILGSCAPCHIPSQNGSKKAYDNYANTSADADDIIMRIQLNPGDRGFMPFKHPKLSDSTINVFKQWKADGLLEK